MRAPARVANVVRVEELLADVAVPVPLARAFTYQVPAAIGEKLLPGARVACEFGSRKLVGVVLNVETREPPAGARLKPISALVDAEPILPKELLAFLVELANYYFAPIGEVLRLALPAMERDQVRALRAQRDLLSIDPARQVGGRKILVARPTDQVEAPGTLRGQAAAVLATLRAEGESTVARLEERFGNARAALKKLASLDLVVLDKREEAKGDFFDEPAARDQPPELNAEQRDAAERIERAIAGEHLSRAFLLFGVTGSGKTEVYLRAIAACRAAGKGALVLVPEIALTPQLVARFRARFGDAVAILHSALGDADRHAMWSRLHKGEVDVAIGARSALFAPVPNLGLVVVDEEHDGSFKQEEGVRYHARDMALLRAHRAGAVAVLGSATPSLESIGLLRRKMLEELDLPARAVEKATLPDVTIIDVRRMGAGPSGERLLSLPLHRALEETLKAKEQAILFLNRRGFAPSVVCDSCGVVATCPSCSVALTFHRARGGRLSCHYCDYASPMPEACDACKHGPLILEGLGTEKLEDTLKTAFPTARIARLDRDVASGNKGAAIVERMRRGEIDVLVGTQMVTKGHDLPNVTLVGVVNADSALSLPDFRASERGFQLLVQVAGRAGRAERRGRVLIQTRSKDHPAVNFAASHDVVGFLEHELADRKQVGYPPYSRLDPRPDRRGRGERGAKRRSDNRQERAQGGRRQGSQARRARAGRGADRAAPRAVPVSGDAPRQGASPAPGDDPRARTAARVDRSARPGHRRRRPGGDAVTPEDELALAVSVLGSAPDVVSGRVAGATPPAWCASRGWSAFLLDLDDATLARSDREGAAEVLATLDGAPPDLAALAGAAREASRLEPFEAISTLAGRADDPNLRGASPRKRVQIARLLEAVAGLAAGAPRLVDFGSGPGPLPALAAEAFGLPSLGVERDPRRVDRAAALARALGTALFEVVAALATDFGRDADDLALGLHACGALGDRIVELAAERGAAVALVGCCPQKIGASERVAISRTAAGLSLPKEALGLANLSKGDVGVERSLRATLEARAARHALGLLLARRGVVTRPGEEMRGLNRRRALRPFAELARAALALRGLGPASEDEIAASLRDGGAEFAAMRRLSLPRAALARVIEVFIARDRAAFLRERGRDARVVELVPSEITPRNVALLASRAAHG